MGAKVVVLYFLFAVISFGAAVTTIQILPNENATDHRRDYYVEVLKMALEKTKGSYGDYRLIDSKKFLFQERGIKELGAGTDVVDVVWTMTSKEREEMAPVIRIPLLKGMLGYRIFIINEKDKEKFEGITKEEELKKLIGGQGHDWPDLKILQANGYNTIESPSYDGLFKMLQSDRIDYFPRGINEPFDELKVRKNMGLMVEEHLMIYYPAPMFFFVNKSKPELKKRIEEGLEIAIKDGSFDKLFLNFPSNKETFKLANMKNRRLFKLENPLLSEETKKVLKRKELIYTP